MSKVEVKVVYSQVKAIESIKQRYGEHKLQKVIFEACSFVRNEAVQGIASGPASGRIYKKGGKTGQRSAAGEYPMTDEGGLIQGIATKFTNKGLRGRVESNAPYSAALEFGTLKMAARPFLQPSLEAVRPKIRELLNKYKVGKN